MPRIAKELSPLEINNFRNPGYHAVGKVAGLLLQVTKTGMRSWILRVRVGGKRCEIGLGAYPGVDLTLAHRKAQQKRDQIAAGSIQLTKQTAPRKLLRCDTCIHTGENRANKVAVAPLLEKRGDHEVTKASFRSCANNYIADNESGWNNSKHTQQWRSTLTTYAFGMIGDISVDEITTEQILQVLIPMWETKTETMKRVRGRIESVLDWAAAKGLRAHENPARWRKNLDQYLSSPKKIQALREQATLPVDQIPQFMNTLQTAKGVGAKCLEFSILTACKTGQARQATWSEIDFSEKSWNIPIDHNRQSKRPFRIPLSDQAILLLNSLPKGQGQDLIFPVKGTTMSNMTILSAIRRLRIDAVPDGFRNTFSLWCTSTKGTSLDVCEMALGHALGKKTEGAYRSASMYADRSRLMQEWANFLYPHSAT